MTISFIDRRCTVDVHQTVKGYSFEYGNKISLRTDEEAIHNFFLKEYQANKFDTVKLRFSDASYYLHLVDGPEKCTKRQLRSILARECDGAWCEEKNGIKRYFVREGVLFSKIKELTQEEFAAYRPTSTIQKTMKFAMGALSLAPILPSHASHATGLGALLFSLLNASPTLAQMPAFGEFRINTNTANDQYNPAVAALNDGGFVVAWEGHQTTNGDIYGQRYNASGELIGSEFRINSNTTGAQANPVITALNDGGFVTAWNGYQTGIFASYGQRYTFSGTPAGSEFPIIIDPTLWQWNPTIAALKAGGFVAVWEGYSITDNDIYGQRYDASAAPIGAKFRINTNTTSYQEFPKVAALNDGGFVAVWNGLQGGDYDIYSQRFNASGNPMGSEFRINTNTTNTQSGPAITALNNEDFFIAWNSDQTGDSDIYGQMYNATGVPIRSEFRLNTNTTNDQSGPAVAALSDGSFVVAWVGRQTGNNDIYWQRFDATGAQIGSEFRLNFTTTTFISAPVIAALKDGGFIIVWHGDQTGNNDIYGQRFDATGARVTNFTLPFSSSMLSGTASSTSSFSQSSTQPTPSPSTSQSSSTSSIGSPSTSSTSTSQEGSSSISIPQTTTEFTSTPSTISSSVSSTVTSQALSSSTTQGSSQSSMISAPSSSQSPLMLSIIDLTYGTDYSIDIDGVNVGTFTITGGTGLYDGTQSNTLILQLDPDADLVGQTITLFTLPSGEEGNFQTIELQGVSCLAYDTQIVQDGGSRFFQATFQATTCSTGSKPEVSLLSAMLRV